MLAERWEIDKFVQFACVLSQEALARLVVHFLTFRIVVFLKLKLTLCSVIACFFVEKMDFSILRQPAFR